MISTDLQDVARRAREIMIVCARLLANPALVPEGEESPKAADAKTWLDLFLHGTHRAPAGVSSAALFETPGILPKWLLMGSRSS